ncbi:MAG: epoxyqueuosine reductase [Candidatus Lokiarchaeota archaeon]|nr:epoxyqueuosine reductase [Candidatus Lokiarchaeota archaeon]
MSENITEEIKKLALELGADKIGIADAELAEDPPHGHGEPLKILPGAKAIIAIAVAYPDGVFECDKTDDLIFGGSYVATQKMIEEEIRRISLKLAKILEKKGYQAAPLTPQLPRDEKRWTGVLSLRYIGQLAGLGEIGQSNLLVTPEWGPRIQMGAVVTDAPLEADGPVLIDKVCKHCNQCVEKCPPRAIAGDNYPPYNYNINRCMWGVNGWFRLTKVEEPPRDWVEARPTAQIMIPKYERQYPQIKEYQDWEQRLGFIPLCAECVIHCTIGKKAAEKRRAK